MKFRFRLCLSDGLVSIVVTQSHSLTLDLFIKQFHPVHVQALFHLVDVSFSVQLLLITITDCLFSLGLDFGRIRPS